MFVNCILPLKILWAVKFPGGLSFRCENETSKHQLQRISFRVILEWLCVTDWNRNLHNSCNMDSRVEIQLNMMVMVTQVLSSVFLGFINYYIMRQLLHYFLFLLKIYFISSWLRTSKDMWNIIRKSLQRSWEKSQL